MRAAMLIIALALLAPRAHAQADSDTVQYRAKEGDTLALIAAEYYGDRNKAAFLRAANRIDKPRPLKPNERIRIPYARPYTTSAGDTFESIAAAYLGDAKRGSFLAEFNGLMPDERIPSGTDLFLPYTLTHRAEAVESIAQIATKYFGNDKNATLIKRYNFYSDKDSLEKGETVIVPVYTVRLQTSKLPTADAESTKRRDKQKKVQARAAKALPAARLAWRSGDFAQVKTTLAPLEPDVDFLDTAQAVEVGVLFGAMEVAFERTKEATDAFKRVLERKPGHALSPYYYSPKVLAVWKDAGGASAGEAP